MSSDFALRDTLHDVEHHGHREFFSGPMRWGECTAESGLRPTSAIFLRANGMPTPNDGAPRKTRTNGG